MLRDSMLHKTLRVAMLAALLSAGGLVAAGNMPAPPAEAAATGNAERGAAKFRTACAGCHRVAEFKPAPFSAAMQAIAAGKMPHRPKLVLTTREIADLVAAVEAAQP